MKNNLCITLLMLCLTLSSLSFSQTTMHTSHKTIVAYFSATGTTRAVAEQIAKQTNATLCEIAPLAPYTAADLDWHNERSRSSIEMNDVKARPAMIPIQADIAVCDTLYLGYPIWWDLAPRIINTFIETCSLEGTTIIPFATSGSSTIGNSVCELKKTYPALHIQQGRLLNNASEQTIRNWIKQIQ